MHVFSRILNKPLIIFKYYLKSSIKINIKQLEFSKKTVFIFGCSYFGYNFGIYLRNKFFISANCLSINENKVITQESAKQLTYFDIWDPSYVDIIYLLLAILSAIVAAIINIQIPLKLGNVVNVLSQMKSSKNNDFINLFRIPSLELLTCYVLQALSTTSYISLLSVIGERLAVNMKRKLFERIIIQDAKFFDSKRSGDLLNRITVDVQDFKSSFKQSISQGLRGFITIIGSTISLVLVSKELTAIVIMAVPSLVLIGSVMGMALRALSREAQIQNSKATDVANESIINIRTVKSFAMEDVEIETFGHEVNKVGKFYSFLGVGIGVFQGLSNLAINGIVLGVLFTGGYMMNNGDLTPGNLMSFLVASQTIQKSLSTLSTLFGHLVRANASGARITEFMALSNCNTSPNLRDLQVQRYSKSHQIEFERKPESVEFRNISFAYPTRDEQLVLENFSLYIPEGSIVAICGESGAGKSTIASLIQRLYDPILGDVLINGIDIREMKVSDLRSIKVGVVSQQPQLFAKTIRENIRYGKIEATNEEVEEAARQAQAHEFIVGFQNGYDTMVGERGGEALSGGQRQRIAIARAILKNPNILILDEATSALDSKSEVLVQKALKHVMKGRTVLIIAHRLSTIQNAENIVVLKHGKIVEMGPHDKLMKLKGHYYELVKKLEDKDH